METQLTRRGQLVAALTVSCVLLGAIFGARSLNALVAPGVVALGAAVFVVHRADAPSISRTLPADGHPAETHEVSLAVADCGAGNYAIRDRVGDGLSATDATFHVTERSRTLRYDVTYERRGAHEFGPARATVTDVLGLTRREFRIDTGHDRVLVYPELVDPPGAVRSVLETVVDLERRPGRDEFDSLREYDRGDSLRDVHWKSSAKRPDEDLVVKEFLGRTPTDAVRIGVAPRGSRSSADAAARAAASVAVTLLDEGIEVGIETPGETIGSGVGPAHREAVLRALARLGTGSPAAGDPTLRISAADGEAVVHAGGRSVPFRRAGEGARGSAAGSPPSTAGAGADTDPADGEADDGDHDNGDEAEVVP